MRHALLATTLLLACALPALATPDLRNERDLARAPALARRAADWRNGEVVYQVMVDRFAPSDHLARKQALYAAPRRLRSWSETPKAGTYVPQAEVWSHELDFWGGDLQSLRARLDYIQGLGVDTLYLNPIFLSLTNHKYDTWDYHTIDPAIGSHQDLRALTAELHRRRMHLVLDGVFNHMGRQSPHFQEALKHPRSPWRRFFKWRQGTPPYVGWMDVANLPELNLEDDRVKDYVYRRPDSVVQRYIREDHVDGWRLDVAFDLGFKLLADINRAEKRAKPDSVLIGEVWNYPEEWQPALDGVMNMHGRAILLGLMQGKLSGPLAASMWNTLIADAGLEPILKTWLVLDNHDTPRLASVLPQDWQVRMARTLQLTLPGSPCLYYGSEVGMTGGDDPEQRAPMRWDLAGEKTPLWSFHRWLLAMRRQNPALRYGDFRLLPSRELFAFLRRTNSVHDTVVVLANPTDHPVEELVQLRESKFQDDSTLLDLATGEKQRVLGGMIAVTVPAHVTRLFKMDTRSYPHGYNRYDRMN